MFAGFRKFLLRGNAVDLAVAVVMGAAFGGVVNSVVKDLITPLIAAIVRQPDFSGLVLEVHGGKIAYGSFLNALFSFLLVSACVYFLIVLPLNAWAERRARGVPPADPATKACPECLSTIPVAARRCAFCASPLAG